MSENATRCLVCGRTFAAPQSSTVAARAVQAPRLPEVTLSLPIALGLVILILGIGAAIVFAVLRGTGRVVEPTQTPTVTMTPTNTATLAPTATNTPLPTFTPLPPLEYTIQSNDTCNGIALFFNVSLQSIVLLNNLPADCGVLSVGQKLQIPQPTPTASPMPTSTLSGAEATDAACEKYNYTVTENDTLSGIAGNFNVSMDSIKEYNGLTGDVVYSGQDLIIPLCQRLPPAGETATPTVPPPYLAPNLLLPADGASFVSSNETITLQWSSVGTLRENETYMVTVEDVTEGTGRKLVDYVTDTKYILPRDFQPTASEPHIIRWYVVPMRQTGTDKDGEAIWATAGTASEPRVFSWSGGSASGAATTPSP
ncbi:MAG: LysM peptidoglycan-binding domain-containing protein [Chloroflexi bacterium]|nr:LysM peptidoglycan-binding domain-containing protein [Chloroflexota bacterium]